MIAFVCRLHATETYSLTPLSDSNQVIHFTRRSAIYIIKATQLEINSIAIADQVPPRVRKSKRCARG